MSHEGGAEPTQRTVAELLAKYGQETGERAPRRRRRRAEDVEDTGAQAIIERVMSESGEMPAIREDMAPPGRTSHRQQRTEFQRPVDPPRRRHAGPPPSPSPSAGPPTVATPGPLVGPPSSPRMTPAGQPPEPTRPGRSDRQPGPPPSGRRAAPEPPARHQQPSQPLPQPSQPLPKPQPSQQLPKPPQPSQPLPKPQQHSGQLRKPPAGPPPGQRSGVQPSVRARLDGDATPPPPTKTVPPAPSSALPPAPPPEPMTEELPRVPTYPSMEPAADPRRPGPDSRTRLTPAVFPQREQFPSGPQPRLPEPEEEYGGYPERDFDPDDEYDRDYEGGDYDGDYGGDYAGDYDRDKVLEEDGDRAFDDLDDDLARELDDLEGERAPRSAAREWLIMIGQLALGVLGGAAVWLGFNWLWGRLPQAALVLALAVIVGMVFIVRRIRRAEDLQTTVYAVLVGLLATVSPAALLLLNR